MVLTYKALVPAFPGNVYFTTSRERSRPPREDGSNETHSHNTAGRSSIVCVRHSLFYPKRLYVQGHSDNRHSILVWFLLGTLLHLAIPKFKKPSYNHFKIIQSSHFLYLKTKVNTQYNFLMYIH